MRWASHLVSATDFNGKTLFMKKRFFLGISSSNSMRISKKEQMH